MVALRASSGAAAAGSWLRGGGAEGLREVAARGEKNPREQSYSAASMAEAKVYRNTPLGQGESWPIRPTFHVSPNYCGPVLQL
jgi:hypothetical protein